MWLTAPAYEAASVPRFHDGGAAGDTDDEDRDSAPSPSGGMAYLRNTSNMLEKYQHGDKPRAAAFDKLFTDSQQSQSLVGTSVEVPVDASYVLPAARSSPSLRSTTRSSRRTTRSRRQKKRDSMDKLYSKPAVPYVLPSSCVLLWWRGHNPRSCHARYTQLRGVEALATDEVSSLAKEEFVTMLHTLCGVAAWLCGSHTTCALCC